MLKSPYGMLFRAPRRSELGRLDPGRTDLGSQILGLRRYLRQVRAGLRHAGVLGADEASVGGYRFAHPLDGAVKLRLELATHHLAQPLAQGIGLFAELGPRLAAPVRQDKEAETRDHERRRYPGYVRRRRRGYRHRRCPEAQGPDLDRRRLGYGALQGKGELLRLVLAVVALDNVRCVLSDGLQEL